MCEVAGGELAVDSCAWVVLSVGTDSLELSAVDTTDEPLVPPAVVVAVVGIMWAIGVVESCAKESDWTVVTVMVSVGSGVWTEEWLDGVATEGGHLSWGGEADSCGDYWTVTVVVAVV